MIYVIYWGKANTRERRRKKKTNTDHFNCITGYTIWLWNLASRLERGVEVKDVRDKALKIYLLLRKTMLQDKIKLILSYHHHVLPKGRSFTSSAGTYAAVLLKAGLPPQTEEPRLQFYQGLNRCGSFPLLSAPHSLFSIWIDFKRSQGHQRRGEESGFG